MNRALFALVIAVTAIAVVWAFSIIGGPEFARQEKRDQTRVTDLREVGAYYRCVRIVQKAKADGIAPRNCAQGDAPPPDLSDPLTGEPYAYSADDASFEVCAIFEVAPQYRVQRGVSQIVYDGQQGCVKYYRTGDIWSMRTTY